MGQIISTECVDSLDPKVVRLFIRSPDGQVYTFDIVASDYAILAMLPGFPPSPCK